MSHPDLNGCSILIVEDEPLILLDIATAFNGTGAHLTTTGTLKHAQVLVEHDGLSAAILDHALSDGDSGTLCLRLRERGIPFMMYSALPPPTGPCSGAPHLPKPATHTQLRNTMARLLQGSKNKP
jgi:DNA-binding response OmpR family regulator